MGIENFTQGKHFSGYGAKDGPQFWVLSPFNREPAGAGNGAHMAFLAADWAAVDAFHATALAKGATDEGAPGSRPQYHDNYYGAYARDLDGNKIQAVCHRRQ